MVCKSYRPDAYKRRDYYMVDHSVCGIAVYDLDKTIRSGTAYPDTPDAFLLITADDLNVDGRFDLIAPRVVLWKLETVWAVPGDETELHTTSAFPALVVEI